MHNTVLKHGEWQYLIGALLAPALLFWIWRTGASSSWLIWQGVVMLGWSVYDLIDKASRTYGYIDQSGGRIAGAPEIVASPGAGLYVATLGSVLVLAGGLLLRYPSLTPNAR